MTRDEKGARVKEAKSKTNIKREQTRGGGFFARDCYAGRHSKVTLPGGFDESVEPQEPLSKSALCVANSCIEQAILKPMKYKTFYMY